MVRRLALILIVFSFFSCDRNKNSEVVNNSDNRLSVTVNVVSHFNILWFRIPSGYYNLERASLSGYLFPIEISIRNNSDSAIHFYEWACSWQRNWISNKEGIEVLGSNCDANAPIGVTIEPHKIYSHKCFIYSDRSLSEIVNRDIKLGMILISEKNYHYVDMIDYIKVSENRKRMKEHIIWSNPFKLN
jgi:hypothetical protein